MAKTCGDAPVSENTATQPITSAETARKKARKGKDKRKTVDGCADGAANGFAAAECADARSSERFKDDAAVAAGNSTALLSPVAALEPSRDSDIKIAKSLKQVTRDCQAAADAQTKAASAGDTQAAAVAKKEKKRSKKIKNGLHSASDVMSGDQNVPTNHLNHVAQQDVEMAFEREDADVPVGPIEPSDSEKRKKVKAKSKTKRQDVVDLKAQRVTPAVQQHAAVTDTAADTQQQMRQSSDAALVADGKKKRKSKTSTSEVDAGASAGLASSKADNDCLALTNTRTGIADVNSGKKKRKVRDVSSAQHDVAVDLGGEDPSTTPEQQAPAATAAKSTLKATTSDKDVLSADAATNPTERQGQSSKAFQRVRAEEWIGKAGSWSNNYEDTFGQDGWGYKAQQILGSVRGRDFRHEKTKKKRGSYRGGQIDQHATHSIKFDSDNE